MHKHFSLFPLALTLICVSLLSGCFDVETLNFNSSGSSSKNSSSLAAGIEIGGQHTVSGATITLNAVDGTELATANSDANARYTAMVTDQASYPYIITATSGTDLVSGITPDFPLISVITGPDVETANINIFTTLMVIAAQAMPGGLTAANLEQAKHIILAQLNFGLDTSLIPDPISTPVTAENAASLIKANVMLDEMILRAHNALQVMGLDMTENAIVTTIATDIADGYLNGNNGGQTGALISAIVNIVSGEVLVEGLSNNINVNGTWATDLIDNAILTTQPAVTMTTADVSVTPAMLQQAKTAIKAAQAIDPSEELSNLALIVNSLTPGENISVIEAILPQARARDFTDALTLTAGASNEQLAAINAAILPPADIPTDDQILALAWAPNTDQVIGYIVYFGPTPETALNIASETSVNSVKYGLATDLGLNSGDVACFRLKALNHVGLSEFSGAACMQI